MQEALGHLFLWTLVANQDTYRKVSNCFISEMNQTHSTTRSTEFKSISS
jgi:hypothetical protein